MANFKHTVTG